ncbi:MAG: hypothetical protein K2I10_09360 [Lachnospiraceae bacterium]|nr:hypothetical protein [Lachnospiraceae bacterium]
MRKIYKIAAGLLMAGVLIAGIGSGVAFAEYSTFEYCGSKILEGSKYLTKTVSYQVDVQGIEKENQLQGEEQAITEKVVKDGNEKLQKNSTDGKKVEEKVVYLKSIQCYRIVEDASVAKDCIKADIKYLTDREDIQPEFMSEPCYDEHAEGTYLFLDCDFKYGQEDMRIMMRTKDMILEDLKKKQIGDYHTDGIEEVIIRIHPEAEFKLESSML